MIHRTVSHHRIRYILGATGAGRSRLSRHGDNPLSSFDYVFIKNDETVRAWLLSNPVLDDPLELMLYCYRDRNDRQQDTPALTRVNYLAQNDVSKWARDPEARIGHMHIREARDLAYSESAQSSDTDGTNNKHTSHISETSSPGSDSGDRREFRPNLFLHNESGSESSSHVSESETAGDNIPDILPLNGGILARSIPSRTTLGIKRASQLNTRLHLESNARPSQGDKILKRGALSGCASDDEISSKRQRRELNSQQEQLPGEGLKRRAEPGDGECQDPRSKRLRTESPSMCLTRDFIPSFVA